MTNWDRVGSCLIAGSMFMLVWAGYYRIRQISIQATQFMDKVESRSAYAESIAKEFLQRLEAIEEAVKEVP